MRQNSTYKKTVLKNGLRIITEKMSDVRSVAFGVWIDIGTRDETESQNGISHFIEHMVFKGTRNRSTQKIASSLESLGGSLNAFTSREQTCFHAYVLDEHLDLAVDVIADFLMHSTYTPTNIKREKLVVVEEINESLNTPSDRIHDLFSDCFWKNQAIGRPIMGTEETVMSLKRHDLISYMNHNYHAGRIVIAAAGNVSHRKLVRIVQKKMNFPTNGYKRNVSTIDPEGLSVDAFKNGTNQTHFCIGFPGVCYTDPDKYAHLVLHYYLGGGMSSVLFQKIREQKGMAYTVYTFPDFYSDCGTFGAYMAVDKRFLKPAVETMLKEFHRMKKSKLTKSKMDAIKDQCRGHLLMGMESTTSRMNRLARQEIMSSEYHSHLDTIRRINRVKPKDVIEVAQKIFNSGNMVVTTLGSATGKNIKNIDWSIL